MPYIHSTAIGLVPYDGAENWRDPFFPVVYKSHNRQRFTHLTGNWILS